MPSKQIESAATKNTVQLERSEWTGPATYGVQIMPGSDTENPGPPPGMLIEHALVRLLTNRPCMMLMFPNGIKLVSSG